MHGSHGILGASASVELDELRQSRAHFLDGTVDLGLVYTSPSCLNEHLVPAPQVPKNK
jgi:hypothetical protein